MSVAGRYNFEERYKTVELSVTRLAKADPRRVFIGFYVETGFTGVRVSTLPTVTTTRPFTVDDQGREFYYTKHGDAVCAEWWGIAMGGVAEITILEVWENEGARQ